MWLNKKERRKLNENEKNARFISIFVTVSIV